MPELEAALYPETDLLSHEEQEKKYGKKYEAVQVSLIKGGCKVLDDIKKRGAGIVNATGWDESENPDIITFHNVVVTNRARDVMFHLIGLDRFTIPKSQIIRFVSSGGVLFEEGKLMEMTRTQREQALKNIQELRKIEEKLGVKTPPKRHPL